MYKSCMDFQDNAYSITIEIKTQKLHLFKNNELCRTYDVSTAKNGVGEKEGSFQTPRGKHIIRAKIGDGQPVNTMFDSRRPIGIYNDTKRDEYNGKDLILTRILWLSGKEVGKNRLGDVDTMQRYIYIHGSMNGKPGSLGCIRMRNDDLIDLFDQVPAYTPVNIIG